MKITFAYLTAFSQNGGIEKFNCAFIKALTEIFPDKKFCFLSSHDKQKDANNQYLNGKDFHAYGGKKFRFVVSSFFRAISSKLLIIGHINLTPLAFLAKLFYPTLKMVLIVHGIEVWGKLNFFRKWVLQNSYQIMAVSEFTKQQLIENHNIKEEIIKIFPNTIDPFFDTPADFQKPEYLLQHYNIKPENTVLITIGRISNSEGYKGYDRVIEILPELVSEIPNIVYLIIGSYDEVEKKRLDELIKNKGVSDSVIFAGYVRDEELTSHYLLGDLFVMPSKGEGFGIVFIEAMACGLPVLAGNKDGSSEALDHGRLGTLVDPDNSEELLKAIKSLIINNKMSTESKLEKQKNAFDKFGFENFKKRLKAIL